jgi:hypothetical protein
MQANGAEMLRLACCLATEAGIAVCAPVHDAVLIESTEADIDAAIETTEAAMREASRLVLAGFELRNDRHIVAWPDRYIDERGVKMFELVESMLWESVESIPF